MAKPRTHLYEGMYILNATLSEEARKKALEKITAGMEVRKIFDQGRRKLAYEINGKREGFYYVIFFEAPTDQVKNMWNEYHLNEDLIRFATLRAPSVPESLEFKQLERE